MNPRKPTNLRVLEGNRGHRPLPHEPQYSALPPEPPEGISRSAKKVWDDYLIRLGDSSVLTIVDGPALAELCENRALLAKLRKGWQGEIAELTKKVKSAKKKFPGNAETALLGTNRGARIVRHMANLNAQIMIREREFGLTPSSRSRVHPIPGAGETMDPIERELCGGKLSS